MEVMIYIYIDIDIDIYTGVFYIYLSFAINQMTPIHLP